uniref:Uncharacterized protein n=1 Tax=Kalanchoe fedtschenkoi TaxID=63787 RepID=A0A7N0VBD8_KALFE
MAGSSKVLLVLVYTALVLLSFLLLGSNTSSASSSIDDQVYTKMPLRVRRLLLKPELAEDEDDEDKPNPPPKKTKSTTTTSSQSKLLTKPPPNSDQLPPPKPKLKKLNSTTSGSKTPPTSSKNSTSLLTTKPKKLNSTAKATTDSTKSPDVLGSSSQKNKTNKIKNLSPPNATATQKLKKMTELQTDTKSKSLEKQNPINLGSKTKPKPKQAAAQKSTLPSWIDQDEEDDLITDFRSLPSKFQQSLFPDIESISQTSKAYLTKANKEMTRNFKPLVGTKYASTTANLVSYTVLLLLPLLLVSLLISRVKTYSSLQKLLIFINIYLAIYFTILALSAVATGLEPLRFFFATSASTYVALQILQTLCYVMFLLLSVMYLVLVFSTKTGLGPKALGLAQTIVGLGVGLHYYVAVFHRVVTHQPPKTNWKVHAVYATCFLVICLFSTAERRKKEYLEEGGEEGKKN